MISAEYEQVRIARPDLQLPPYGVLMLLERHRVDNYTEESLIATRTAMLLERGLEGDQVYVIEGAFGSFLRV
jgi:hypothetical protein